MIKKKNERQEETKEHMRGGTGSTHIRHYFSKDEMKANCRLCSEITLPPGASIGTHPHTDEEEIYIITKGTGVVIDDGREETVNPGDCILTGEGKSHSIRNDSKEDLEFVAVINLYS